MPTRQNAVASRKANRSVKVNRTALYCGYLHGRKTHGRQYLELPHASKPERNSLHLVQDGTSRMCYQPWRTASAGPSRLWMSTLR